MGPWFWLQNTDSPALLTYQRSLTELATTLQKTPSMAWPDPFTSLYKKFKLINTHLTFLASFSRQTIPTFEHIQKLNDDISRIDLQMIKDLLPDGEVTFDYIDENQLLIAEKVDFKRTKGGLNQNQPRSIDDAYEAVSNRMLISQRSNFLFLSFAMLR